MDSRMPAPQEPHGRDGHDTGADTGADTPPRHEWQEPQLTFVEPELTKQGDLTTVTGEGFFGTFIPDA